MMIRLLVPLCLLPLITCAQGTPSWLTSPPANRPGRLYFIGVGEGDTRQNAENSARGKIAVTIKAKINSDMTIEQKESLTRTGQTVSGTVVESTSGKVRVTSEKVLEGIVIESVWTDPETKKCYALAVLNRTEAATRLQERIAELDGSLAQLEAKKQDNAPGVETLKLMSQQKKLMIARTEMNEELRVVDPAGMTVEPAFDLQTALAEMDEFLRTSFRINASGKGAQAAMLVQFLVDSLTERGLLVSLVEPEDASPCEVRIVLAFEEGSPRQLDNGWYEVDWKLTVKATDTSTRKILGSSSKSGRSRQLTPDDARTRAEFEAGRTLGGFIPQLYAQIVGD